MLVQKCNYPFAPSEFRLPAHFAVRRRHSPTDPSLSDVVYTPSAMARANTYASATPGIFYYPDRKWPRMA